MTTPSTPMQLSKKSQDALIAYHYACYALMTQQYNIREQMRASDLAYIRENDLTIENWRGRLYNSWGDANKFQNITVPVVMPQVETSVVYQSSVFLTGSPLFGVVASPKYEDDAIQMETVIDQNATWGSWKRELMIMMRDGFKYNLAGAVIDWEQQTVPSYQTDTGFGDGRSAKINKDTVWAGNTLKRLDMYNTFFDTRVAPTDLYCQGEFVGTSKLMGRIQLKQFIADMANKDIFNINEAFESSFGGWSAGGLNGGVMGYYIPPINPNALINKNMYATTDWMQWAGITGADSMSNIKYNNLYEVTTQYARILPSDFAISSPQRNTPQVWKFIIINHQVIILAERQTNAHNWLPVIFTQPNEDGLTYQTKSLADNVAPMQSVSTALMNGVVAARRRALTDRVLYDPSRISEAAINSTNPSAKIPCRPAAYGTELSKAVYQFPYKDDQSQIALTEIQNINVMSDYVAGHNRAQQGQFVKGNKTRHEYDDIMRHASGRDQLCSILLEDQFFTPLKYILKSNILQYQVPTTYYNQSKDRNVEIDPVALRKAIFEFKVSDGLLPADKLINADTASVALQTIGSSPQLTQKYDTAGLFSYIVKTQGGQITEFEKSSEQVAYEQAMSAWQQSCASMVEMFKVSAPIAAKDTPLPEVLKMIQSAFPPQPKPQDYGYNPNPTKSGVTNGNTASI